MPDPRPPKTETDVALDCPINALRIWVLADDRAGNRSQCMGVAQALGLSFETRELRYGILAGFPNTLLGASFAGLTATSRAGLSPPWPEAVIAAGRRTAPVARYIKRLSGGRTRLFQIMHPGGGSSDFDLIAVPNHDTAGDGPNILRITGAPHGMTNTRLVAAATEWGQRLENLPRPRIVLIVGGSTRNRRFGVDMARELGRIASGMAVASGGSLMVTTSRRTDDAGEALLTEINVPAHIHRWEDSGDNPYIGYLGLADAVIVTGESVSMCSEACAVPVPVYIYGPPELISAKHRRFHEELFQRGFARPLDGRLDEWTHPPLNAANSIAHEIAGILNR